MRNHASAVILISARREKNLGISSYEIASSSRNIRTPRNDGDIGVAQSPLKAVPACDDRGLNADTRHSPCGCATDTSGVNYLWRSGPRLLLSRQDPNQYTGNRYDGVSGIGVSMAPEVV